LYLKTKVYQRKIIHEMLYITPYTASITLFYKMEIVSPIVHYIDKLMLHECEDDNEITESTECRMFDFILAQIQAIGKKLTAYDKYLALVATHIHTIFGSNLTLPEVNLLEESPKIDRSPFHH
jgi:hypothetical protein